jgi:hypothetical protein
VEPGRRISPWLSPSPYSSQLHVSSEARSIPPLYPGSKKQLLAPLKTFRELGSRRAARRTARIPKARTISDYVNRVRTEHHRQNGCSQHQTSGTPSFCSTATLLQPHGSRTFGAKLGGHLAAQPVRPWLISQARKSHLRPSRQAWLAPFTFCSI